MPRASCVTRNRILAIAIRLFDSHGVRSTTIEAIAAAAGVTKRTVYNHFRSKDDLMATALNDRSLTERHSVDALLHDVSDLESGVMNLFKAVSVSAQDPRWKGCSFIRASIELAGLPGHPAVRAAREHREHIEHAIERHLSKRHIPLASHIARRIVLLLDGAITHSVVHHDPDYAMDAGHLAVALIEDRVMRPAHSIAQIG